MKQTLLKDNTQIWCILPTEAKFLDYHIEGYFKHGIHVPENAIIFDVGANIGLFGVRVLQKAPTATVYAFEPVPTIFEVLKKNASFFLNRFFVFDFGVSNANENLEFTYFPNSPALSTAFPEIWQQNPESLEKAAISQLRNAPPEFKLLRLLPNFIGKWVAENMQKKKITFTAKVKTISDILISQQLSNIDILKIDCEGAELKVLQGIKTEDWHKIQQVVVEVFDTNEHLQKCLNLLQSNGFRCVTEEDKNVKNGKLYNIFAVKK
jgi:FkbM family methyltransferase